MRNLFKSSIQNALHSSTTVLLLLSYLLLASFIVSCSSKQPEKEEQIRIQESLNDTSAVDTMHYNSIKGNLTLNQIQTTPNSVLLTGMAQHRLVTVYKSTVRTTNSGSYDRMYGNYYESGGESEREEHFMPGLDLIYGYNLLNIAHYDLTTEKLNYLFEQPVLVKSLYYPSFVQDSLYEKPITRNYYLVSAYDADTNSDTLLNKKDLRRIYYFNSACSEKIQLLPPDYSVMRSQYDPKNDVMYIFARHDANGNGIIDKKESMHIFWLSLAKPATAKRFY
jgi:hypothetical protein